MEIRVLIGLNEKENKIVESFIDLVMDITESIDGTKTNDSTIEAVVNTLLAGNYITMQSKEATIIH